MNVYTSKGIIFRTLKYSETSIISDIYTREKGLRSFIVSGIRTAKSGSKAAIYQPINIVEIVSYDQDEEKLARIKEIRLAHHYQNINNNVIISSVAIFIIEICRNAVREREANLELFDFLEAWFLFLDDKSHLHPCVHILFMLELSNELGFGPMNNHSESEQYFDMIEGHFTQNTANPHVLNMEESLAFKSILEIDRNHLQALSLPKHMRDTITDNFVTYFKLHLSGFKDLYSLDVLRSVL